MEYHNGCQLFYRYDTDVDAEWFLRQSVLGGQGDQRYLRRVAGIYEQPSRTNATELWLRLKNNGDSGSGGDYWFVHIYAYVNV